MKLTIKKILASFGYIKIPVEAVQLSLEQEYFLDKMHRLFTYIQPEHVEVISKYAEGQKVLTRFLRTGRF